MRILAQQIGKPSVWRQMKEYIVDGQETLVDTETIMPGPEEAGEEDGGLGVNKEQGLLEEEQGEKEEQDPG